MNSNVLLLGVALLSGCTEATGTLEPSSAPTTIPPTAEPSATEQPTQFDPTASAETNLQVFDAVGRAVLAATPAPVGIDFVSALVSSGFDKAAMQMTAESTTLGKPSDAIFWSVNLGEDCLIGQLRPLEGDPTKKYFTTTSPPVSGGCLIGATILIP